jgi:hypothetical protein
MKKDESIDYTWKVHIIYDYPTVTSTIDISDDMKELMEKYFIKRKVFCFDLDGMSSVFCIDFSKVLCMKFEKII